MSQQHWPIKNQAIKTKKDSFSLSIHKSVRSTGIAIILLLQFVFLSALVFEHFHLGKSYIITATFIIGLILFLALRYVDFHHQKYLYDHISLVIWVPIGGVLCYLINLHTDLGVVISAALVGFSASILPNLSKKSTYLNKVSPAIYCGAFIGMSSFELAPSIHFIIYSSIVAAIILITTKSLFHGIGGRLGTIAFIGVSITSFIFWLLQ